MEPGIHTLSHEAYHGDPCPAPSASAGFLWTLWSECAAKAWQKHPKLNPDWEPSGTTPDKTLGQAAHKLILEGYEAFDAAFTVLPDDFNGRTKEGKQLRADIEAAGKTALTPDDAQILRDMAAAVWLSPQASAALAGGGKAEQSVIWQDRETGLWCRARPDWLPDDNSLIVDYKTAADARPTKWARHVADYGYHLSAAHYTAGVEAVTGTRPAAYLFIVQEKSAPYLVVPAVLDPEAMEWGATIRRAALRRFADCLSSDKWPGYADGVTTVYLPNWTLRELELARDAGDFAAANANEKELNDERDLDIINA